MKTTKILIAAIVLIIAGCDSISEKQNKENIRHYDTAFVIGENDLIPEGITYDPLTERFFLSSIHKHKIIEIDKEGGYKDFIKSDEDGIGECLGLKVDSERRRLWAVSNMKNDKKSFVHIYDLDTKKLVSKLELSSGESHLFNDLAIGSRGDAYLTDTEGRSIYYVTEDLANLELFIGPDSLLTEVNGIVISPDNSKLFAATNSTGINIIDIDSKSIAPIGNWLSADTRGIDGLMLYKNSLIGIRNGIRGLPRYHAVRYFLNEDLDEIIQAKLIDPKSELVEVPTTGVIAGDDFYMLAVTSLVVHILNRMDEKELLNDPVILKYALD